MTRRALGVWFGSRLGVALLTIVAMWTVQPGTRENVGGFVDHWDRWDVGLFTKVARWGYFDAGVHYKDCCTVAFFPGMPIAMRVAHIFVGSWVLAGLLVSLVAGAVASVSLARLAVVEAGSVEAGPRAVLFLVLSPYAVFLAAGYSEALFLAFAVTGWLAAKQKRWALASVMLSWAAVVRITGLFLAVAFVVEWVVERRRAGERVFALDALWLAPPFLSLGAYVLYLHARTHDWLAWQHAQEQGWHRSLTAPWRAFRTTWHGVVAHGQNADFAFSFGADIVAVLVGVAVVVALLWLRRWSEAVFVGLGVAALATSQYYQSVARSALLWFPVWVLLAQASLRRKWLLPLWCATAAPVMAGLVVAFTTGHWVD